MKRCKDCFWGKDVTCAEYSDKPHECIGCGQKCSRYIHWWKYKRCEDCTGSCEFKEDGNDYKKGCECFGGRGFKHYTRKRWKLWRPK